QDVRLRSVQQMTASFADDDVALFQHAKKSEQAFESLYRAYAPAVYLWFLRHAASEPADAADLTAETFARVILSIGRFRGSRAGSGTMWLYAIARHVAADHARDAAIARRASRR